MDNLKFDILIFDSDLENVLEIGTPELQFSGLQWNEAVELCRMSFAQGFKAVIWTVGNGDG